MLFERRTSSGHYSATSTVSASLTLVFQRAVWTRRKTNTTRTSTLLHLLFDIGRRTYHKSFAAKSMTLHPRSLVPCSFLRRDSWQLSLSPLLGCVNISTLPLTRPPPLLPHLFIPLFLVSARTERSVSPQHWCTHFSVISAEVRPATWRVLAAHWWPGK